jgi:hypothetical protein
VTVGIFVGDGGCASWGSVQVGVVEFRVLKLGCSTLGVQVGVCRSGVVNSWFPAFGGVSLPTTSR